jgi:hypothetical protein
MKFIAGVPGVRASKNGHLYTPHKVAELAVATREYVLNVFAVDNASRKHLSERKTEKPKLTLNRGWGNRAL